jgi:hypothetical protein
MSRVAGAGFTSPFIAGADDPIHGAGIPDDNDFGTTDPCDFENNSPDTLQSLNPARKDEGQTFVSPNDLTLFKVSTSPNDGSFHEYSSDSAESSRKGDQTSPNSNDTTMDGMYDAGMDGQDSDPFEGLMMDPNASSFMDGMDGSPQPDQLNFDFTSADINDQAMQYSQAFKGATVAPSDTLFNNASPTSDGNAYEHQRQNSQCSVESSVNYPTLSREVSPMSKTLGSHQSTPSAAFQTPSPPVIPGFSTNNFLANAPHTTQQQWMGGNGLTMVDAAVPQRQKPRGAEAKSRQGAQPRAQKAKALPTPQQMYYFGTPQANSHNAPTQLVIKEIPQKSRVETQIRLRMVIKYPPPGIAKLHLPTHTISKPKLQIRPPPPLSPNTLELSVSLVCTSAMAQPELRQRALHRAATNPQRYLPPVNDDKENSPQKGAEVRICQNCMGRERKRAARKKVKQADAEKAWCDDEAYRVVVFNTHEIRDWKPDVEDKECHLNGAMYFDAPVRIACYCRHHGEKLGFNMIFTLKDSTGRLVAQSMSDAIMITDDHKTAPMSLSTQAPPLLEQSDSANIISPATTTDLSQAMPDHNDIAANAVSQPQALTPPMSYTTGAPSRTLSRPASPSQGGPSKKRKSSGSRIPNGLTMTKMETSPAPPSQKSAAVSPFQAPANTFTQPEAMFGLPNGHGPYGTNPPTPNANDHPPFNFANHRSPSMDNLPMAHLYSAPPSQHPSRAPSPNGLRAAVNGQTSNQMTQAIASNFLSMPLSTNQPRPPPMIHKVIPNEGPRMGGAEVTILGTGFFQGLDVFFGSVKAVTTTYWGESSLVCLLPPSPVAGLVQVTTQHSGVPPQTLPLGNNPVFFRYVDDSENQLMRLALQCVGGKTLGTDLDVSALARHVIDSFNASQGGGSGGESSSGGPMYNQASTDTLELQLLRCLDVIDLDDSPHPADLDRISSTGHTMLHLASSLGYRRLVAGLLARGADPNALDNGHFTPLHIAAVHDQPDIARRLILAGANPRLQSLSGELPMEIAESVEVIRAIRFSERPTRSRSETSLRSRASSVSSLRSFIEPLAPIRTLEGSLSVDPGEESPEYTSGDFEDEDPDEDTYLSMRRSSRRQSNLRSDRDAQPRFRHGQTEAEEDMASPANAMGAAFKEQLQQQLQQIQQSINLHLQNLPPLPHLPQIPQMPTMPTLPGRPALPDYQAYLQQAPFMRRMTQYMPSMTGGRPDSQDRQSPKMDHRWWDLSSYMGVAPAPPPSYEEIFPQQDMDAKQASAAQAAAEAEADMKCAALFDHTSSSASTELEKPEIPSILKIGRKNAITKEQQEQFLRAREARLKRLSNDRNLFFIWIPLLVVMVCAMTFSYFPSLFVFLFAFVRSAMRFVQTKATRVLHAIQNRVDRVVEIG